MIREEALQTLRHHVGEAFKAGMPHFPHYTLHGEEHLREVDRLAKLVGGAIPGLKEEELLLLRLAVLLHDYAMVHAPTPERARELRSQVGLDLPFADVIRKTHQDEIEQVLTGPEKLPYLAGMFDPQDLRDACTVARHHRLHDLTKAPFHLRGLCALMRLVDELDIGKERAPIPTYQALRADLSPVERLHWLKHICTRAVADDATFGREQRGRRRILGVYVAVEATEQTWRPLQEEILRKLRKTLDEERINTVLRETFQVEVAAGPADEEISGTNRWYPPDVQADLAGLLESGVLRSSLGDPEPALSPAPSAASPAESPTALLSPPSAPLRRELRIRAIPPETLAERLCKDGRLTVIGNRYVPPPLENAGGVTSAPSRIYVGPADCGKTRASLQWIEDLTGREPARWVILRPDMGTLPESIDQIVLDTSAYEQDGLGVPQKAILFLDDLPAHLPPAGTDFSPAEAVRRLFSWFHDRPGFRERRVVGTLRLEDVHARPEWPRALPSLGEELELLRVLPLPQDRVQDLWQGMAAGSVARSRTAGLAPYRLKMSEEFLAAVAQRPGDPEAVATFVHQKAIQEQQTLLADDAAGFHASAVETWLRETWPAMRQAYGEPARVFLALARFLEAGLRPGSGYQTTIRPAWEFHEAWGGKICEMRGAVGGSYLSSLERMMADGYAVGESGEWVRPRFDFLLQAEDLAEIDCDLPEPSWFAGHAMLLTPARRRDCARLLGTAPGDIAEPPGVDASWRAGWGLGRGLRYPVERDPELQNLLLEECVGNLSSAAQEDPDNDQSWYNFGVSLEHKASREVDPKQQVQLWRQAIEAYRKAVEANSKNAYAWVALGVRLGALADREAVPGQQTQLRLQEIDAFRKAIDANPNNAKAWFSLAFRLGVLADCEADPHQQTQLRLQEIDAYRKAVDADPTDAKAWFNLAFSLGVLADREADPHQQTQLRLQEIDAYRKAVDADPSDANIWYNLGVCLGEMSHLEPDETRRAELRRQYLNAAQRAVDLGDDRYNLACALALNDKVDEALTELASCLSRGEISREHVAIDPDWRHLVDDPRFQELTAAPP